MLGIRQWPGRKEGSGSNREDLALLLSLTVTLACSAHKRHLQAKTELSAFMTHRPQNQHQCAFCLLARVALRFP